MKYIDLYLQKIDEQKRYTLPEIIEKFRISVILGHPGSGKSSLLSKYQEENNASAKNIKKLSLKEFMRFGLQIKDDVDILLLDGIDEYRIATNDTTFVMEELGHKLNGVLGENKSLRVVLTCRELDWYGEDQDKLKDGINADVELFYLLPLNQEQQEQLASLLEIKEPDTFLAKFEKHGFLMNPQMFFMLSEIWKDSKEEISSKGDLYKKFIKLCVEENNPTHKANEESKDRALESEQALKLIGYLSYFYFFCGQEEFSDKLIKEIADAENGYPIGKIKQILKTKAFLGDCFIHKTIAEFALAYHIVFFKTSNASSIDEKIKSLFVRDNDKIPTKLRGAYAWICSLSEDLSLIEIDPYYQAIHADNSMFDIQQKQAVLKAVRLYSNKNPYFLSFSHKLDLGGFYTQKLDQALISEYTEAIRLNNHYVYFLNNILAQGKPDLSEEMFSFLENILLDDEISHYYKEDLISCFDSNESQKGFLLELLNKIKDGALKDPENLLKDLILTILYPDFLSPKDILPYLISYERTDIIRGHCFYLFKTKYSDKRALVDEILQNQKLLSNRHNSIVFGVRDFINDFFLEVLLTYDETLECAEKIYECIQYFYQTYHMHYRTMFKAFGEKRKKEEKQSQEKLQKLSNELFRIHLEKFLEKEDINLSVMSLCLYDFPYYCDPTNKKDVCFSKMNPCYPIEKNRVLFFAGLNCVPQNERSQEEYRQKAKEYQIEKDYEEYFKPPKEFEEYQMKAKEEELEQKKKEEENKKSNEEYFRFKKDEEILSDFKALSWISDLCFSEVSVRERRISQETFKRLEVILKNMIYQKNPLASEHLTLQEMAKRPQNSIREIDTIYYTALCINEEREGNIKIQQIDKDFREYLYLVALWHECVHGVKSSSFCSVMEREQKEETRNILRRYINALMSIFCQSDIIEQRIQNEQDIQTLKMLANTPEDPNHFFDSFIRKFLIAYGFQLESDLKEILSLPIGQNNKITINALLSLFGKSGDYSIKNALALYSLFQGFGRGEEGFRVLQEGLKVKILRYMMHAFNTEESLQEVRSGMSLSNRDMCLHFLKYEALRMLKKSSLQQLRVEFEQSIWRYKILHCLNEKEEQEIDQNKIGYPIKDIKEMILKDCIVDLYSFFREVCLRLKALQNEIQDNANNDKEDFYGGSHKEKTPKSEEAMRDVILRRLQDKYSDLECIKEKYQANNRVDISVSYRNKPDFKIQIECKKDNNSSLMKAINEQLIRKYLNSNTQYGIYLVFYCGAKSSQTKEELVMELENTIKDGYQNKIKILLIDLRL